MKKNNYQISSVFQPNISIENLVRLWVEKGISTDFFCEDGTFKNLFLILWILYLWFWNILLSSNGKANCKWKFFKSFSTTFVTDFFHKVCKSCHLYSKCSTDCSLDNYVIRQPACKGWNMASIIQKAKNQGREILWGMQSIFISPFSIFAENAFNSLWTIQMHKQ